MQSYLQFALVTFTSVLFIVDPIAVVPTYLVITQGQSATQRRATARRAVTAGLGPRLIGARRPRIDIRAARQRRHAQLAPLAAPQLPQLQ